MANLHTYYQPNEYESQLIVAGIVKAADVDLEFQEYLRKSRGDECQMNYTQWNSARRRWDELNAEYEKDIAPFYTFNAPPMPTEKKSRADYLLKEMISCESALGY